MSALRGAAVAAAAFTLGSYKTKNKEEEEEEEEEERGGGRRRRYILKNYTTRSH